MIILEAFQIAVVVCLLVYSTFTDLKNGIVRNKHLLSALAAGALSSVPYYIFFAGDCFFPYIVNIAVASAISLLFYFLGIWGAGDSKLLISVILLIPARIYCLNRSSLATGFFLVTLVFSAAFIYMIAETIYLSVRRSAVAEKKHFSPDIPAYLKRLLFMLLYVNTISSLLFRLLPDDLLSDTWLVMSIHFVLLITAVYLCDKAKWSVIAVLAAIEAVLIITAVTNIFSGRIYWHYLLVVPVFLMIRIFSDRYNYKKIPASELKTGMILSCGTTMLFLNSRVKGLPAISTEDMRSRITEAEVKSVVRWSESKKGCKEVVIVKKIPFALFISIGTLLFLICVVNFK